MKTCPFCAEEIQDAAIVCKHCGRDLVEHRDKKGKRSGWVIAAWCLIVFVALVLIAGVVKSSRSPSLSVTDVARATQVVDGLRVGGLLVKFDCRGNHDAYVNPVLWAALNHDQKRSATMALAISCVGVGEPQFVHVKDNTTGKDVAQFYGGAYTAF